MVQSLNTKALVTLASVLRRPWLAIPHVSVDNVSQIDYEALRSGGRIQAVVFDKDNTLTAPYVSKVHPLASEGLQRAQQVFGVDRVAILSNSAGTLQDDPDYRDALEIEQTMGVTVIRHAEKKPGGLQDVLDHFGLDDPAELCVVGDRLLTDVVFGNLHGMLTVHTQPLCQGSDNSGDNLPAKMIRSVENRLLYGNPLGRRLQQNWKPSHKYWAGETECPLVLWFL